MKTTSFVLIVLIGAGLLAGCDRISEPWDSTGRFEQERMRADEQETALRQRALQQADRTYGAG